MKGEKIQGTGISSRQYQHLCERSMGCSDSALPDAGDQDAVDSAQFDVNLQTEVGEGLCRWLHHILDLNTLRGHAQ